MENNILENVVNGINDIDPNQDENSALVQLNHGRQRLPRFLMNNYSMEYRIRDPPAGQNSVTWTMQAFRELYDIIMTAGNDGNNRFTMSFSFAGIENMPAYQKLRQIEGYTFDDL